MRCLVQLALALLAFAGCAHHSAPTSLGDILARNRAATWGANEPSTIGSLEYEIHIKEAKFELDGIYKVNRLGQMRIDLYSGSKRVYTEGFDGESGWALNAEGKASDESPTGSAALWHGTQFPGKIFTLDELPARGHRLESVGRESIGGVDYYVVNVSISKSDDVSNRTRAGLSRASSGARPEGGLAGDGLDGLPAGGRRDAFVQ